jgi:hypothetical protein
MTISHSIQIHIIWIGTVQIRIIQSVYMQFACIKFALLQFLVMQSASVQSEFIQSVFIQSVFIQSVSYLTWLSVKKSSSLSGTKGTLNFSTGAIPYFWVCFFFAFGAKKVANTVLLLSGRWMHPPLSLLEEYKYPCLDEYPCLGAALGLRSSWSTWWLL